MNKATRIHFIGIGGIGVSGIAQLALKKGNAVSGSDIKRSVVTDKLEKMGARVFVGHDARHVNGCSLVVYSSAIGKDNPEIREAARRGIPVKRRAEFLSDLMADKTVVTVTGAHGKTTTSSLAAKLLLTAGLKPTAAVGGIIREDGNNISHGDSEYFVAEADESDGTFLCYAPTYSIITNIDHEHLDHYGTYENLLDSFGKFVLRTKPGGCVIYCAEDPVLKDMVRKSGVRAVSYSCDPGADVHCRNISLLSDGISFDCVSADGVRGRIEMVLLGRHNVLNALAVCALAGELGIKFSLVQQALKAFRGVERRFQIKLKTKDLCVVDDYGHHPSEIAATIASAKLCRPKRLIVVFQPHRFSRTKLLFDRFPSSFSQSDLVVITDIYAASEKPLEGVSAQGLAARIKKDLRVPVEYAPKETLVKYVGGLVRPGDLVLFLGAGDITRTSDEFTKSVQGRY